jgi:hypothetical protein
VYFDARIHQQFRCSTKTYFAGPTTTRDATTNHTSFTPFKAAADKAAADAAAAEEAL